MGDYPDWTRLFYLTGTDITIPISIDAVTVILPISIDAVTVTLDINIVASDITMPVSIEASTVTLDVSISAATVTIDINFSDQSVAVFDAAKWFAHQAQQYVFVGTGNAADDGGVLLATYTVAAGKNFYVCGLSYGIQDADGAPKYMMARIDRAATDILYAGSAVGGFLILDMPLRFVAGQTINYRVWQYGSGFTLTLGGAFWGYLEDA
ncbi:MAG: hypothetical protein A2Y61_03980 [Chloroflexi bacterium RBG_13_60_13]|nr:MAG: hypothetical protein A2Y61_03980 [Chloroflexi bacterium RBG_13_60_13]